MDERRNVVVGVNAFEKAGSGSVVGEIFRSDPEASRRVTETFIALRDRRDNAAASAAAGRWGPDPVFATAAQDDASIAALTAEITRHQSWARESGRWDRSRGAWRANHAASLLTRRIAEVLAGLPPHDLAQPVGALYATLLRRIASPDGADP